MCGGAGCLDSGGFGAQMVQSIKLAETFLRLQGAASSWGVWAGSLGPPCSVGLHPPGGPLAPP